MTSGGGGSGQVPTALLMAGAQPAPTPQPTRLPSAHPHSCSRRRQAGSRHSSCTRSRQGYWCKPAGSTGNRHSHRHLRGTHHSPAGTQAPARMCTLPQHTSVCIPAHTHTHTCTQPHAHLHTPHAQLHTPHAHLHTTSRTAATTRTPAQNHTHSCTQPMHTCRHPHTPSRNPMHTTPCTQPRTHLHVSCMSLHTITHAHVLVLHTQTHARHRSRPRGRPPALGAAWGLEGSGSHLGSGAPVQRGCSHTTVFRVLLPARGHLTKWLSRGGGVAGAWQRGSRCCLALGPLVPLPPPPGAGLGVMGGSVLVMASNPGADPGQQQAPGSGAGRSGGRRLAPMHVLWSSPSS